MMVAFYIGCGVSLAATAFAPTPMWLAVGMFVLGVFAAIYHPVGMAMLIEASGARGRTLAFNGVCGNLGVSLRRRHQRRAGDMGRAGAPRSWRRR